MNKKTRTELSLMRVIHRNNLIVLAKTQLKLDVGDIAAIFNISRQYVNKILKRLEVS